MCNGVCRCKRYVFHYDAYTQRTAIYNLFVGPIEAFGRALGRIGRMFNISRNAPNQPVAGRNFRRQF